jgi:uncharacterized membrane protein YfcA
LFNQPLQGSTAETITVCSASGIIAAILAGLLGIGGGIVIVPALLLSRHNAWFEAFKH